jgi:hypothetical protein
MTGHRLKKNPLSSFENKQRSFLNISYMVFFTYFTIYGDSWHIGVDRDWRECKDRQLWVEIVGLAQQESSGFYLDFNGKFKYIYFFNKNKPV